MRSKVMSNRIRHLLMMSSLGVLGAAVAGCSSGFQRFDRSIYEDAAPQQTSQNPYPGNLDRTTTASAGTKLVPLRDVAPQPVQQDIYQHSPEPTYVGASQAPYQQPAYQQPAYQQPAYQQPAYQPVAQQQATYQPPAAQPPIQPTYQPLASYTPPKPDYQPVKAADWRQSEPISSTSLPQASSTPTKTSFDYSPPKPDAGTVFIPPANPDNTKTASVGSSSDREGGWTSTGGTAITIREGETLYNLSKRYGVPVEAIREANGFSQTDVLKTGQRVVIPNYVFSHNAAISAPDNDPNTRAASASTGYVGEAKTSNVSIPTKRPEYYAAISPKGETEDQVRQRYQPTGHVSPPEENKVPNYGIVVGEANTGTYTVQPGDSLSKIAAENNTTVAALQRANGLTGSDIRIGQKLALSGGYDPTTTASVPDATQYVPPGVDPIITGSTGNTGNSSGISAIDTDTPAPARSGISQFRWPVKGRVVSEFGGPAAKGKNEGIDISVPEGTAVRAAENGVVIYTGSEISTYGKLILVRHDDDWVSAYAHNRDFEVKKGDRVRRGQIIARSGKTGDADRPKLHFELRKESRAVDPRKYLSGA